MDFNTVQSAVNQTSHDLDTVNEWLATAPADHPDRGSKEAKREALAGILKPLLSAPVQTASTL